jgi:hypothetical protein
MPGKSDLLGDTRLSTAHPILGPFLGQVECSINECLAFGARIEQEDTNLAVGCSPRRTAVLWGYPCGLLSLLEKACFIDDQHTLFACQVLDDVPAQFIAYGLLIPFRFLQEPLHPMRIGFPKSLGHLPAILAPHGGQQTPEVALQARADFRAANVLAQACGELFQHLGCTSDAA